MSERTIAPRLRAASALVWPHNIVGPDEDGLKCYMLVDAACDPGLHNALMAHQEEVPVRSLYQGEMAANLADVCPYIVALAPDSAFAHWLLEAGWGQSWGVFVHATGDIDDVRRHFRRFTVVNTEDGKALLFRFYDPRVLGIFMPTCDAGQLGHLFRDVEAYVVEGEGGAVAHSFAHIDGGLRVARHPLPEC